MKKQIELLNKNKNFKRYFSNTSWLFIEKIARMLVSLMVGVWLARYLGPENFGTLSYILSFVGLFSAFTSLGLDSIVVHELVKNPENKGILIGTGGALKFLGGLLSIFFIILASLFSENNREINELIFLMAIPNVFLSFNVVDFYFQSKVLSRYSVYSSLISLAVSTIVKLILILSEAELVYFILAIVFESLLLALSQVCFFRSITKTRLIIRYQTALNLMKNSWPFMLSGIIISIYLKIDQVMIKSILDSESVGQYAIAARLSEIWYFIPTVVITSLFPAVVNAKKVCEKKYYKSLQQLYTTLTWVAILIAVLISFTGNWIVTTLYGLNYSLSGSVLIIHIWTSVFIFFNIANSKWLLIEGLNKYRIIIDLFSTIMNVLLNLVFIPVYGIEGAAWATLFSYSTSILMIYAIVPSLRVSLKMFITSFNPFSIMLTLTNKREGRE